MASPSYRESGQSNRATTDDFVMADPRRQYGMENHAPEAMEQNIRGTAAAAPLISVVIPTYNRASYLGETIHSAIAQTSQPLEIIVVDDGSTDRTERLVREFKSPIPIVYYRQTNQGVAAARNRGVEIAKGSWIAFLDSDDLWDTRKLAIQTEYATRHADTSFVYSDKELIDELGRPLCKEPGSFDLIELIFDRRPFAHPSTVLVRKDMLLKAGGFDPTLRAGEDLELFARLVSLTSLDFVPVPLVKYRVHSDNLHNRRDIAPSGWHLLLERLDELWRNDPVKQKILTPYLTQSYAQRCKECLQAGRFYEARRYARLAFAHRWSFKHLRRLLTAYCPALGAWHYRLRKPL